MTKIELYRALEHDISQSQHAYTLREIVLAAPGATVVLTLWGEVATSFTAEGKILALKLAKVRTYDGIKNLSLPSHGSYEVEPDVPEVRNLMTWKQSLELNSIQVEQITDQVEQISTTWSRFRPAVPDAGSPGADAGPPGADDGPSVPDAGPTLADDRPSIPDAGPLVPDAEPPVPDAGPTVADDGPPGPDARPPGLDAGPPGPDAEPPSFEENRRRAKKRKEAPNFQLDQILMSKSRSRPAEVDPAPARGRKRGLNISEVCSLSTRLTVCLSVHLPYSTVRPLVCFVCPLYLSVMSVHYVCVPCLCAVSVCRVCPSCLSEAERSVSYLSVVSVCCVCPLCLFVVSVRCVCLLCLFVVSVRCVCSLCLFVVSVRCVCSLCLFVVSVRCVCLLFLSVMSVRCVCSSCLFVVHCKVQDI